MNTLTILCTIVATLANPSFAIDDFQALRSAGVRGRNLADSDEYIGFIASDYIGTQSTLEDDIYTACESATQDDFRRQLFQDEHAFSVSSVTGQTFFTFSCPTEAVLEKMPKGLVVEKNGLVHADSAPASWGLDRIDQPSLPLSKSAFSSIYTGKGATVYIIDTGINKDHVDFGGRASYGGDFVNEGSATDLHGHGTHCSGTATGATYGIAKEAQVVGVKVLSQSGSGTYSGVINGINWAIQHAGSKSSVLSLSLGGGSSSTLNAAVKSATNAGHIVVVAAGNSNDDACNASPAGAGGKAADGGVITVMASDSSDNLASYSNWGLCTDIVAPGSHIVSSWIGSNSAYRTLSGTSMATPHVAGVAAVLLEKHGFNKDAAQSELLGIRVSGKIIGDTHGGPSELLQVPTATMGPTSPVPTKAPTTAAPTPAPTPAPTKYRPGNRLERKEWNFCKKYGKRGCERRPCRCTWNANTVDGHDVPINEDFSSRQCLPNYLVN